MDNQDQAKPLDTMTFRAGTLIHLRGMPFWLKEDTLVEGRLANMKLVTDDGEVATFDPK